MTPLEQLMRIADPDISDGFAGLCADCGRARYRASHAAEGQAKGWVYAASKTKCFTCHRRPQRVTCPLCRGARKEFRGIGMCVSCRKVWEHPLPLSVARAKKTVSTIED